MENMRYEVYDSIITYSDNEETVKDILFYLYHTTKDNKLQNIIEDWFYDNEFCVDCGEKLKRIDIEERHTELFGSPIEHLIDFCCPNCDK